MVLGPPRDAVQVEMSLTDARILGITIPVNLSGDLKGAADVILVDIEHPYKIDKNKFASKGRNTPFDGWEVKGRVLYTLCDGKIIYQEEDHD